MVVVDTTAVARRDGREVCNAPAVPACCCCTADGSCCVCCSAFAHACLLRPHHHTTQTLPLYLYGLSRSLICWQASSTAMPYRSVLALPAVGEALGTCGEHQQEKPHRGASHQPVHSSIQDVNCCQTKMRTLQGRYTCMVRGVFVCRRGAAAVSSVYLVCGCLRDEHIADRYAQLVCSHLRHLGVQALAHLNTTMRHQHL